MRQRLLLISKSLDSRHLVSSAAFTTVELLVTLFIAAAFLTSGYQLYSLIIKDGGEARAQARASNIAYDYLQRYKSKSTNPCSAQAILNHQSITADNLSNVTITLNISCPYGTSSSTSRIQADVGYGKPQTTVSDATYYQPVCSSGYILVPGNSKFNTSDFCAMKYEAKNVSGIATSQAAGLPWVSISQADAATTSSAACSGCHLITDNEWLTIAHNVLNVASNWSGGAVGNGYLFSGHNDNVPANSLAASNDSDGYSGTGNSSSLGANQRRTLTLSNGEVIWDLAGNIWEWTSGTLVGALPTPTNTWQEWNSSSLVMNGLPQTFNPSYSEQAAVTSWTTAQGIGQLYTGSGAGTQFLRGGDWGNGGSDGLFYLWMGFGTSNTQTDIGFRVAQGL
jgi:Tfp pilus assembly protein PilE